MVTEPVFMPSYYFDSRESGQKRKYSPVDFSVVESILNARDDNEMGKIASVFGLEPIDLNNIESSSKILFPESEEEARSAAEREWRKGVESVRLLQSLLELAISWRELYCRDSLSESDLKECGISVSHLPSEQITRYREAQSEFKSFYLAFSDAVLDAQMKSFINMDVSNSVIVSSEFAVFDNCYYGRFLERNRKTIDQEKGLPVVDEKEGSPLIIEVPGSFVCSNDNDGLHDGVSSILDGLFELNLFDVRTRTRAGIPFQQAGSVYSSLWYSLARSFEGGRALRCQACGKPILAFDERGTARKFCSGACSKWAQRHPGERRKR